MIRVSALQTQDKLSGFRCEGHAGYASEDEADIICAAITALAGTAISTLTDIVKADVDYILDEGHLECRLLISPSDMQREAIDLVFRSFLLGCRQIEHSYGSQFVHVTDVPILQD